VKIPRWPFDKFTLADRRITTQMKATGEVMALGRTFEEALLKAIRSLEIGQYGLRPKNADLRSEMEIESALTNATDERLFLICEAFHRGMLVSEVSQLSHIDPWFLTKLRNLVRLEEELRSRATEFAGEPGAPARELLVGAKRIGFSDRHLGELLGVPEKRVRALARALDIAPAYKMVDTCAAEFEAQTPYFYSVFHDIESEAV
jgi:carbamoyl-phosphate synthase large subunit